MNTLNHNNLACPIVNLIPSGSQDDIEEAKNSDESADDNMYEFIDFSLKPQFLMFSLVRM